MTTMTTPELVLVGSYDPVLVALSVAIAVLASYAALDLAGRVTSAHGKARLFWLNGGAMAMGFGIWSMHYIGMLAFHLPIPVQYDWPQSCYRCWLQFLRLLSHYSWSADPRWESSARLWAASSWEAESRLCTTSAWQRCVCPRCAITLGRSSYSQSFSR